MSKVGDIVDMGGYGAKGVVTEVFDGRPFNGCVVKPADEESEALFAMESRFIEAMAEIAEWEMNTWMDEHGVPAKAAELADHLSIQVEARFWRICEEVALEVVSARDGAVAHE